MTYEDGFKNGVDLAARIADQSNHITYAQAKAVAAEIKKFARPPEPLDAIRQQSTTENSS